MSSRLKRSQHGNKNHILGVEIQTMQSTIFLSCPAKRSIYTKEQMKQTFNEVSCRLLSLKLRQF